MVRVVPRSLVVVGAEGFLGSQLVRHALTAGVARVTAVCTRPPWRWSPYSDGALTSTVLPGPWWQSAQQVGLLARGADAVVLLPYTPPPPGADRLEHERDVNARGLQALAAAAAAAGAHVVLASSADVYGADPLPVQESRPLSPQTPYATGKVLAETLVADAATAGCTVLRISTVYGPGELAHRAIPRFAGALLRRTAPEVRGPGGDVRDYVPVGDVAAALLAAAGAGTGSVLNVGSGRGRTTRDVLAAVERAVGLSVPARHVPATRPDATLVLDPGALHRQLGVRPSADLERHVDEEVRWLASMLSPTG